MDEMSREQSFLSLVGVRRLRPVGRSQVDRTLWRLAAFFSRSFTREEIARRPGLLQGIDPRARLLSTLLFLVSVSLAQSLPVLLAHGVMVLGVVGLSRIRLREFLGGGFLIAAVFTFLMSLPATLNIFLDGQVMVPLLHLERAWGVGPYTLPPVIGLTREGAFTMATVLLRVLASVSAVLCLSLCTRWVDLLRALRSFRLPAIVLQVVGMTVRYLHAFHAQGEEMHLGKKSRSICRGSLSAEQAWVASRIANAWGHAVHLMTEVSEAMTARGFRGEARFPPGVRFGISEWVLCASTVLTCAGAHLL